MLILLIISISFLSILEALSMRLTWNHQGEDLFLFTNIRWFTQKQVPTRDLGDFDKKVFFEFSALLLLPPRRVVVLLSLRRWDFAWKV